MQRTISYKKKLQQFVKRVSRQENAIHIIITLVLVISLAAISKGRTITPSNIRNVFLQSSIRGVAAVGQAFAILTGNFDLSVGGVATTTALLGAATLTSKVEYNILSAPLGISAGIALMLSYGLGVGIVNGLSISRLRMSSVIVTLATWQITNGIAYQIGRGKSIGGLPQSLAFIGQGDIAGVAVPLVIFIIAAISAYFILNHTVFGKSIYAVGGNPLNAYLCGIDIRKYILSAFLISGFLASLAGIMSMTRAMTGSLQVARGLELDSIASVVVGGVSLAGGRGTLIGVVFGVMIMGIINNGMIITGLYPPLQEMVKGLIIISAVAADTMRSR
ncbi:ABC transporter permease [Chloroflexota bacterium]